MPKPRKRDAPGLFDVGAAETRWASARMHLDELRELLERPRHAEAITATDRPPGAEPRRRAG